MKQKNYFVYDFLDLDDPLASKDIVWHACRPVSIHARSGVVTLSVPFEAMERRKNGLAIMEGVNRRSYNLRVMAYGSDIVRVSIAFGGKLPRDEDNPMFEWDPSLKQEDLFPVATEFGWDIFDSNGMLRMSIRTLERPVKKWSNLIGPPPESFEATIFPDGNVSVPFMAWDLFTPDQWESISLGFIERNGSAHRSFFSLHAKNDEKFAGTGERFSRMNLAGKTIVLENVDALGVNNRRSYKNVPFYVSSRPYGLFTATTSSMRLSFADISTRAVQALLEDDWIDLFFIGGGSVESIVRNYRRITGFPRPVPLWSLGVWMSRMSYFSADEVRRVAGRLRSEEFPCDVIHLDTGWFSRDWKCDWKFSPERFPNPKEFMDEMRRLGFRISLWQLPSVGRDTELFEFASKNGYLPPKRKNLEGAEDFSTTIDFTNPEAIVWYQGLLRNLLEMGASVIKADFGETIDMDAEYHGMPANLLRNIYCLLYQRAAFEITEKVKGEGIIWARAGWAGCQRFPVHWGGDSACTWDGLAGTIRGGLHLGVSGFAFWSHDVPGFHGVPNFMNSWPDSTLYLRWTQVATFTSHFRYHGTSPREPYEYPEVASLVRKWLRLRYAIIPYLFNECRKVIKTGLPIFRALIFHHSDDPFSWFIDDEFYCGDSLLVAPILNPEGIRDVYLPAGEWTDIWTGSTIQGPILLKNVKCPLSRIPVYAKTGSTIKVYPKIVQCTDEMTLSDAVDLAFDSSYTGFSHSILGRVTGLE
ncbi:MAG: alpha-xylosidase [Nitrososphaerota archaeon]|nr:alpha-xylosidase [Candidatus Bathyarchaeota archaeon]MDW8048698.1 alpha-xylosidase [Nitrososphaerota archaeon]